MTIDITGINKAVLFKFFYEEALGTTKSLLSNNPNELSLERSQKIINTRGLNFDYLGRKSLKINLSGNTIEGIVI